MHSLDHPIHGRAINCRFPTNPGFHKSRPTVGSMGGCQRLGSARNICGFHVASSTSNESLSDITSCRSKDAPSPTNDHNGIEKDHELTNRSWLSLFPLELKPRQTGYPVHDESADCISLRWKFTILLPKTFLFIVLLAAV